MAGRGRPPPSAGVRRRGIIASRLHNPGLRAASAMPATPPRKQNAEMLFKGVVCALIGAVILLGPYVARSPSVQELMRQAALVGWFSFVLGVAFIVRALWQRWR